MYYRLAPRSYYSVGISLGIFFENQGKHLSYKSSVLSVNMVNYQRITHRTMETITLRFWFLRSFYNFMRHILIRPALLSMIIFYIYILIWVQWKNHISSTFVIHRIISPILFPFLRFKVKRDSPFVMGMILVCRPLPPCSIVWRSAWLFGPNLMNLLLKLSTWSADSIKCHFYNIIILVCTFTCRRNYNHPPYLTDICRNVYD